MRIILKDDKEADKIKIESKITQNNLLNASNTFEVPK